MIKSKITPSPKQYDKSKDTLEDDKEKQKNK